MKTYRIEYKYYDREMSDFITMIVEARNEEGALKKAAKQFEEESGASGQWIIDKTQGEGAKGWDNCVFRHIKEVRPVLKTITVTEYVEVK